MFGSIKMNPGVVSLLVLFIWKCECCHPIPGAHQTSGPRPIFSVVSVCLFGASCYIIPFLGHL